MVVLVTAALALARALFVPIVIGVLLSYMLEPAVARLVRWGVPRGVSATLVFIVTIALVAGMVYGLRHQASAALDRLPGAVQQLRVTIQSRFRGTQPHPVAQVERAAAELRQLSGQSKTKEVPVRVAPERHMFEIPDDVWTNSITATQVAGDTIVVVVLAYYLLLAGDFFRRRLIEIAGPTLSQKKITLQILDEISAQIGRYVFVRALISAIVGVATALILWALGLGQPGLWGTAAGLLNVVPYVGSASVAIAAALAGFLQFKTITMALVIGGVVIGVAIIEGYVLTPWLTSRAGAMNPAAVFLGLIFWGWLWGLPGLLLAVPILMVMKAICDHVEALQPISSLLGD